MRRKAAIVPILAILLLAAAPSLAATYWVSSTATASSPCTQSQPCKPDNVWSSVDPGDTVVFKNGLYKGSGYMLAPTAGMNGSQSSPITVTAETDGGVRFDGEFARVPIELEDSQWFVLQGFDACCSSKAVVQLHSSADDNIVRRVVAWDAADSGLGVLDTNSSDRNIFEDCAGFGIGRKIFTGSSGNSVTWRRTWARWEGNTVEGPKMAYTLYYQATGRVCENCLGTWDNGSMPSSYYLTDGSGDLLTPAEQLDGCEEVDQARGGMSQDRHDDTDVVNAKVLGSVFYLKGATSGTLNCYGTDRGFFNLNAGSAIGRDDGQTVENVAVFVDPSNTRHSSVPGFALGPGSDSHSPDNLFARDLTSVAKAADSIDGDWTKTDVEHATSVSALGDSIFVGNGAHVCYRYVNGVEQVGQKLWPWPMQDRILAATTLAAAASHKHMMSVCTSTSCNAQLVTDPHAVADVMGDIVAMFGAVPAACSDSGTGEPGDPPPAPTVWRTDTEE